MLAKSRTASEKGRTMKVEMNSMRATRGRMPLGTPGGMTTDLR